MDEKYSKWFDLASSDLMAARILRKNSLFPQTLYHLHQSLEKLWKAYLIFEGYIKKGKEIGHDLFLGNAKILEFDIEKKILELAKQVEIHRAKVGSFQRKEKLSEISRLVKTDPFLVKDISALNFLKSKKKRLLLVTKEKDLAKIIVELDELFKIAQESLVNIINTNKYSENISISPIEAEQLRLDFSNYYIHAILWFPLFVPNSQSLRYPEDNPHEKYDSNHPIITHFDKIDFHLSNATKLGEVGLYLTKTKRMNGK